jgi:hypothetical protein
MTSDLKPKGPRATAPSLEELERLYAERGRQAIEIVRRYAPGAYLRMIARLIAD